MNDPRRLIPGLDRLLDSGEGSALIDEVGRIRATAALRSAQERVRSRLAAGDLPEDVEAPGLYFGIAREWLDGTDRPSLRRVVNGSGVVLHTNLGRAPLAPEALEAARAAGEGYSNLEYDLDAGERGSRYVHCVSLLTELTGAEDALVVNNCAAGLVLALSALARGEGVLVSRGELVEIGGGFRVPEIMEQSGARLVEVGSTNRTRPGDYREGFEEEGAAALLKVHRSNFRISGFTEEASLEELVGLGEELSIPVIHDLGSGLLVDPAALGLPAEPRPQDSIAAGADLVIVSGDKLLGGPQAGIIVGRARWIEALRRNPLCRAVRVDKTILAALETTLRVYRDPAEALERIPTLRMLARTPESLQARAEGFVARLSELGVTAETEECRSVVGGGTYPGLEIESRGVRSPMDGSRALSVAAALRSGDPPVVARVDDGGLHVDLRTVLETEESVLAEALAGALGSEDG